KIKVSTFNNLGRTPVLNVEGFKTEGLSKKGGISLKGVKNYRVESQDEVNAAFTQEKERAKAMQALLKKLHPGYSVPKYENFRGLMLSGRELEHIRFTENSLKNTKIREAKLRGAVFRECDLSGADLRKSDLRDVIFDKCNLNGADFRHCNLSNARIVDCDLFAINLDHSILDQAVIDSCSMGAQSFYKTSCKSLKLSNSQIIHGFFDSADLADAEIHNVLFRECTLTNTHFDRAILNDCYFRSCDSVQEGPVFSNCVMSHIVMRDCELAESQLEGTHISHSLIERVVLDAALFEGAVFDDVIFDQGILKDCYSLEEAPTFNQCRLAHLTIDHAEFSNAHFNKSVFVDATIIASDVDEWDMKNTGMDGSNTIDEGS
ncbi:pentapeptide repeat-containing protein, partial [Endozoicomonas sp.]|nr:pentapeptide repeat-containing protein [Endozoicomonas sp.]